MPCIAVLGDSIFDNAAYTAGGAAVIDHLRALLPEGWTADLLAVDGSVVSDVDEQLTQVRNEHTHFVLSVGGNDALMNSGVLDLEVAISGEAYFHLEGVVEEFELRYRQLIARLLKWQRPLCICTIYEGSFDDPHYQKMVKLALRAFNDAIQRTARDHHLPLIELRNVCRYSEDYANPIEPSVIGGAKIAQEIAATMTQLPAA